MPSLEIIGASVVAFGLLAALIVALTQRKVLGRPAVPSIRFECVSILKPLKGIDPDLEENLRSIFRQSYPNFEIILGAEDANDPALEVADRISKEFPGILCHLVRGCISDLPGWNPKVRNLACLAKHASHDLILISDSNIRADANYLGDLVARRVQAAGGLVWSLFRGVSAPGLGGELESLQLNTTVMGGMCAVSMLGVPSALGKSMLFGKSDLDLIGGWNFLSQFLAEDHIFSEELSRKKIPVTITPHLVDNILGHGTVSRFAARHTRWCRLRIHLKFFGYLFESFLNPVFWSLVSLAANRSLLSLVIAWVTLVLVTSLDAETETRLGIRRHFFRLMFLELCLGVLRGVLWFVPFFSSTTSWRGNPLVLGPRTVISVRSKP
jgi:ceramide glucosyltransferase